MKKTKIITTIFVIILLLLVSVNTYAYSGVIRFNDKIFMPENIENGEGTIEITRDVTNYSLYYQWVEIDNSTYKEINEVTKYNYVVVNDIVENAVEKVNAIINAEKCRVDRIEEVYLDTKEEEIHELLMNDDDFNNESISSKID